MLRFAPDAEWGDPTACSDAQGFIPYVSRHADGTANPGLITAPYWSDTNTTPAFTFNYGGATLATTTGERSYVGTDTKLYEYNGAAWVDRSRAGNYTGLNAWTFAQLGDTSVAASAGVVLQTSTGAAFADQATAPQAKVLVSATSSGGGFIIAANTVDGTYGTRPDAWWCCAVNDATSWTPAVSTQATTGRLVGAGEITGGCNLTGDTVLLTKKRSIYVGRYVGPPTVWSWQEIQGCGALNARSVCQIKGGAFFCNDQGMYLFDGAQVKRIGDGEVTEYYKTNNQTVIQCHYDQNKDLIYVYFGASGGNYLRNLVYNVATGTWGVDYYYVTSTRTPQSFIFTGGVRYAITNAGRLYSPSVSFSTSGTENYITLPYAGSDRYGQLTSVNLASKQAANSGGPTTLLDVYAYPDRGYSWQQQQNNLASYNSPAYSVTRFPCRVSGRWFNAKIKCTEVGTGFMAFDGVSYNITQTSGR
jgi:hypothetical protein